MKTNTTPASTLTPAEQIEQSKGTHQPFSWLNQKAECFPLADFVALTKDICGGLSLCLEMIEISDLEREDGTPTLSFHDSSAFMRHAIAVAKLLGSEADREIEWVNEFGEAYLNHQAQIRS